MQRQGERREDSQRSERNKQQSIRRVQTVRSVIFGISSTVCYWYIRRAHVSRYTDKQRWRHEVSVLENRGRIRDAVWSQPFGPLPAHKSPPR